MDYIEYLKSKPLMAEYTGRSIPQESFHHSLYDFQRAITIWATSRGRAAIFADCGMGKTRMQIEWARSMSKKSLIVAPLSVAEQTIREARAIGVDISYVRTPTKNDGIYITNYEMLKSFSGAQYGSIVLDESSILKSVDGKTRSILINEFSHIPYRLCCTATPAPNDISEIANHAEFLGIMTREKLLSTFFVHDDKGWRLRGHASNAFYRWLASWAVAIKNPADIGYDGGLFVLPDLHVHEVVVKTNWRKDGQLFAGELKGITDRASVRKRTAPARIESAIALIESAPGQVVVWCGLNDESRGIASVVSDSQELHGSMTIDQKIAILKGFVSGDFKTLITKPKIAGRGMNFQNADTQIFLGLGDSWEDYYQCIRRLWRYGQTNPVKTYVIVSDHETGIVDNIAHKEREAEMMTDKLVQASRVFSEIKGKESQIDAPPITITKSDTWTLYHGDCVDAMRQMPDDSIDLSVFSPPFMALYQYTGTVRDVGNSHNQKSFFAHFGFVSTELARITKPGRICCMHLSQVPAMQVRDGYIGMRDFRGPMIQCMETNGWIYHGECTIDKDPQAQAIRIRAKGLAFAQLEKDAAWMRPALADMLLLFRAPGDNHVPVKPDCNREEWIEWARPVWYGVRETHTLNAAEGRDNEDDRHIHPLQLDFIERCIRLWSNRGETVFDPFGGIGSTAFMASKLQRKSIGVELKDSYVQAYLKNMNRCEIERSQQSLFEATT